MRDVDERLRDIQDAITQIGKYTKQGRDEYDNNELVQTWVIRHLEIIGEAARAIPQEYKDLHSEIPWKLINGMRNILVHVYFGIDQNVVWSVVEHELPTLKVAVDTLLEKSDT